MAHLVHVGALLKPKHLLRTRAISIHLTANDGKDVAHRYSELRLQEAGKVESSKDRSDMVTQIGWQPFSHLVGGLVPSNPL